VLTASIVRAMPYLIVLMMEASISESLNVYETTGRNTPEDFILVAVRASNLTNLIYNFYSSPNNNNKV
jgi:hypothetical protein